jgi:LPS sulfotransferase NodH
MTPFLVVGMPRTGSTLLQTTLGQHPDIRSYSELFHPVDQERMGPHAIATPDGPVFYIPAAGDALDFLRQHVWIPGAPKAIGFKLFADYLKCEGTHRLFLRLRDAWPSLRVIHIARRNLLECWASHASAKATGRWVDANGTMPKNDTLLHADPTVLSAFFHSHDACNRFLRETFDVPGRYMSVYYEDMVADFHGTAARLYRFLGVADRPVVMQTHKQRARRALDMIDNVDVLRTSFSGTPYGDFFRFEP